MAADDPLVERLRAAESAVDRADLAPDLRTTAFVLAFTADEERGPSMQRRSHTPTDPEKRASINDWRQILADRLGADQAAIELVFDYEGEEPAIIAPPRALSKADTRAMGEVTLLLAASRQALSVEEWTASQDARNACHERGVFSANHYADALKALDGKGVSLRGRGQAREIKVNAKGYEAAGALVAEIARRLE